MAIQPATRLGPYEVLSAIGAGGMGGVYKTRNTRLLHDVALKVLPRSFSKTGDVDMMKRFGNPARTVLFSLIVSLSALTGHAQAFSTPKNLSNTLGSSSEPRIAVDGRGNINMVWNDNSSGAFEIFFTRSSNLGSTFSAPQNISNNNGASFAPQMGLDGNGNIYVVWTDNSPGNDDIFFSRSIDGGTTFSPPKNLSNNIGNSFNSDIVVDIGGAINVVWQDSTAGNLDIFFARSTDGGVTFSAPQDVSNNMGNSGIPQIAVTNSGAINVVWQDDTTGNLDVLFSSSTNGGTSFSTPQNLSNDSGASIFPEIALDNVGTIGVVWEDTTPLNSGTLFSRSTDGGATFSAPLNISNNAGITQFPQIAVDSGGKIDVIWEDNSPGNFDIFSAAPLIPARAFPLRKICPTVLAYRIWRRLQ